MTAAAFTSGTLLVKGQKRTKMWVISAHRSMLMEYELRHPRGGTPCALPLSLEPLDGQTYWMQ